MQSLPVMLVHPSPLNWRATEARVLSFVTATSTGVPIVSSTTGTASNDLTRSISRLCASVPALTYIGRSHQPRGKSSESVSFYLTGMSRQ